MTTTAQPGSVYRLIVRSADEAVQTIRERFGAEVKVLSVQQQGNQGLAGLFGRPKLEVVVQVGGEPAVSSTQVLAESSLSMPVASQEDLALTTATPAVMDRPIRGEPRQRAGLPDLALPDLLRRAGFSETMLARLSGLPAMAANHPLHMALVDLGRELRRLGEAQRPRALPLRTAFLGSCGVGRTTALCKWLAAEVFSRKRMGRVVKVEFDQPNPAPQLDVFCEALGLTLEHYAPELDLSAPEGAFVYADLPGLRLHELAANRELVRFLDAQKFTGRVLVLHALYDHAALRAAYAAGRELGATHLVFTHCDELAHWGKLIDFLIDGELTPLFLATGPSLSGNCAEDAIGAVLHKTLPGS